MRRRCFFPFSASVVAFSFGVIARAQGAAPIRGMLKVPATLQSDSGETVRLNGDEPTLGVLQDKRLEGADLELMGKQTAPGQFTVDPIHTRALFVHKDGKKLLVTYWCDVCYIRTYTPGRCWCCQDDTTLDLIDPSTAEKS